MSSMKLGRAFASVSVFSLMAAGTYSVAHAQTVSGEVTQSEATSGLAGVRIAIPSIGAEAETSANGQFRIVNVPPGNYELEISRFGELLETRQVTVTDAGAQIAIDLDQRTLDTVVVTGRRGALQTAAALERDADGVVSIVTSDDIGQFGDPTVAESLQRIAGVSINRSGGEGQQVSIRGLPTEFATVTLNGARLGSSDPEINSTNLDFFAADNLSQIVVSKSLLPEMDADAIAGSVDLKMISALSRGRNSVGGRLEYAYQDKAETWNPKVSGDLTRIVELANGSRIGFAGGISWSSRELFTDDARVGDGLNFMTLEQRTNGRQEYFQAGRVRNCADVQRAGGTILECYLIPVQLDFRSEEEKKERFSLSGQVEWETGSSLFQLRGNYFDNSEELFTNRITYSFDRSTGNAPSGVGTANPVVAEIVSFGVDERAELFGVFEDARSERRLRPRSVDEKIWTIGFEGTTDLGSDWSANYGVDLSENSENTDTVEARFRSDDITLIFSELNRDGILVDLAPEVFNIRSGALDPTTPAGFPIRLQTINGENFGVPNEQSSRSEDRYETYYANLDRRFTLFNQEAVLKFGAKHRSRERTFDFSRIEYLVDPNVSLADFPNTPRTNRSDLFIPFYVERDEVQSVIRRLISEGRPATEADIGTAITILNLADDFTAKEDVTAGYVQLRFEPIERLEVIAGLRAEQTDYFTTGSAVRQLEFDNSITQVLNAALTNGGVAQADRAAFLDTRAARSVIEARSGGNDYTKWFPSVNLKWAATNEFLVRASYSEGLKRPEFREAAAIQFLTTVEQTDDNLVCNLLIGASPEGAGCPNIINTTTIPQSLGSVNEAVALLNAARAADDGNAFRTQAGPARNPFLEPLTSQNFDASVAWYPNVNTVLSIGVFHKRIDNFIVPITLAGQDVTRIGFDIDDGTQNSVGISAIETFANGDKAEITGLELNYYQAYTFLPGLLTGLFVQANATIAESSASSDLVDRDFRFPDQSDLIGNVSIGWENERFSVRGAMVYQGDRLRGINTGALADGNIVTAGDEIEDERTQFDINVRWDVRDSMQLYVDAINITDAEDNRYFRGSSDTLNGSFFSRRQNYGATYQAGVRFKF